MEKRNLKCTCRCGRVFYVEDPVRYGNPKCPECGTAAVKVQDSKFVPYSIWSTNVFYVVPIVILGFTIAWALGFGFPAAVLAITCGVFVLATVILNYYQDREYQREHPAYKQQVIKAPPKRL